MPTVELHPIHFRPVGETGRVACREGRSLTTKATTTRVATKRVAKPTPTPTPAAAPVVPAAARGTWLLQADAAARTGFSVSAIRKWRRAGLVADRKVTAGGSERVEVRLEDVEARRAEQPPERPRTAPSPPEAGPPPGSAIIPLADLEALYTRVREAEGRSTEAAARHQAAEVDVRHLAGEVAELRRQLQAQLQAAAADTARAAADGSTVPSTATARVARVTPAAPTIADLGPADSPRRAFDRLAFNRGTADLLGLDLVPPAGSAPPPPVPPTNRTSQPAPIRPTDRPVARPAPTPHRGPAAAPPPAPASRSAPPADRASGRPPAPTPGRQDQTRPRPGPPNQASAPGPAAPSGDPSVESLASELRRLYARLDGYRREPTISRARERQRERDLADYDAALLQACSALAVPTGLRSGQTVSIERRAALTRTLARLGLDVRAQPATTTRGG